MNSNSSKQNVLPPQVVFAIKRLRMIRLEITQESLESAAAHMRVSRAYISNIENFYTEPRISTLITLANYYGISIDELFWGCPTSSGRSRIPSKKTLIELAKANLGLDQRRTEQILELDMVEELWLGISCTRGKDEETVAQYRDWLLMKAEIYR